MSIHCKSVNPFTGAPCIRKTHATVLHWDASDSSWTSPGRSIPNGCKNTNPHHGHLWLGNSNELTSGVVFSCDGVSMNTVAIQTIKTLPPSIINVLFNAVVTKAW